MNIGDALYNFLVNKSLLTNLISTRLYPNVAPQGRAFPYVVFHIVDTEHAFTLAGGAPLAQNNFVFEVYAQTYSSRDAVKEALRNILHGRGNTILSQTDTNTVNMKSAHLLSISDGYDDAGDGNDLGVFAQEMTFVIAFAETVPTLP